MNPFDYKLLNTCSASPKEVQISPPVSNRWSKTPWVIGLSSMTNLFLLLLNIQYSWIFFKTHLTHYPCFPPPTLLIIPGIEGFIYPCNILHSYSTPSSFTPFTVILSYSLNTQRATRLQCFLSIFILGYTSLAMPGHLPIACIATKVNTTGRM